MVDLYRYRCKKQLRGLSVDQQIGMILFWWNRSRKSYPMGRVFVTGEFLSVIHIPYNTFIQENYTSVSDNIDFNDFYIQLKSVEPSYYLLLTLLEQIILPHPDNI